MSPIGFCGRSSVQEYGGRGVKGVVLAGGNGSRLYPLTLVTNKHLLPVFDQPMIHFPLRTLAGMGITQVMVILGGRSIGDIVELLSDGHEFGLDLTYRYQRGSSGIAHAIGLTRDFIGPDPFCVVLGDNILRGDPLAAVAREFEAGPWGAGTLLRRVTDAHRFGVAEFDDAGNVIGFEEKPEVPKSDSIPIGVYFLRPAAFDVIDRLEPSARGELEITDVLNHHIREGGLFTHHYAGDWHDAGTIRSLLEASNMAAAHARDRILSSATAGRDISGLP
jgi:glucose-1-phosphate thymidylyltransferase